MSYDDYKNQTPETFGGINDELTECNCCGKLSSPFATNEAEVEFWLCNECYAAWEVENG